MNSKVLLGSHNTFTYCKPKSFWHYFCIPFARCQNKNIIKQIESGIQLFDIRVRFDNSGYMYLCHGLFKLAFEIPVICYELSGKNKKYVLTDKFKFPNFVDWLIDNITKYGDQNKQYYFRLILETSKENIVQELFFKQFCKEFDNICKSSNNLQILGCNRKFDWKCLYNNELTEPSIFQHISSYPAYPESIKVRWYEKICPWLYAKRTNKKFLENLENGVYDNYETVSYDFI